MSNNNWIPETDFAMAISSKLTSPMAFACCYSGHIASDVAITNQTKTWGAAGLMLPAPLRALSQAIEYGP